MAEEIRIPKLGMSAVEMTLVEWMFGDGERVEKGDIIYTVETDKTTVEIEAQVAGTIRPTGVEGEVYPALRRQAEAMRARDEVRLGALRLIKTALKKHEVDAMKPLAFSRSTTPTATTTLPAVYCRAT